MTNLTNFNRDMSWIDPDVLTITWPTNANEGACDGFVYDKHAYAVATPLPVTATGTVAVGCCMTAPIDEPVPYRVKADLSLVDSGAETAKTMVIGYVDSPVNGANPLVGARVFGFPIGTIYDDVWCIRPSVAHAGKPLFIGMGLTNPSGDLGAGKITIQRLIGKPDNFATAVQ